MNGPAIPAMPSALLCSLAAFIESRYRDRASGVERCVVHSCQCPASHARSSTCPNGVDAMAAKSRIMVAMSCHEEAARSGFHDWNADQGCETATLSDLKYPLDPGPTHSPIPPLADGSFRSSTISAGSGAPST